MSRAAALLLLLALPACGTEDAPPPPSDAEPRKESAALACGPLMFEGSQFTICRFDAERDRIELIDGRNLRSLAALEQHLGPRAREVRFAMNAGMYDEEGAPIGLFVSEGREAKPLNLREGSGNFHLLPNGVFAVDAEGKVSVTPSAEFREEVPSPRIANQSGPMLVIDGELHPRFDTNGPSQLIRNGVGVRDEETAYFAMSEEGVSFGRFARLFRNALGTPNALYLDGTVSSLWHPANERQDAYSSLGPMIVVFRPSSAR